MKKFLSYWKTLFAVTLVAVVLPSCSDDEDIDTGWTVDFYACEIDIEIRDTKGNNLLDPSVENNIVGENITLAYEGKIYDILWNTPYPHMQNKSSGSRAYMALFYGMAHHLKDVYEGPSETNGWIISLGEFDGAINHDIVIPLKINDKIYNIRFVHELKPGKDLNRDILDDEPLFNTYVYLDGKKCEDGIVRIIL